MTDAEAQAAIEAASAAGRSMAAATEERRGATPTVERARRIRQQHGSAWIDHRRHLLFLPEAPSVTELRQNIDPLRVAISPGLWDDLRAAGLIESAAPVPRGAASAAAPERLFEGGT